MSDLTPDTYSLVVLFLYYNLKLFTTLLLFCSVISFPWYGHSTQTPRIFPDLTDHLWLTTSTFDSDGPFPPFVRPIRHLNSKTRFKSPFYNIFKFISSLNVKTFLYYMLNFFTKPEHHTSYLMSPFSLSRPLVNSQVKWLSLLSTSIKLHCTIDTLLGFTYLSRIWNLSRSSYFHILPLTLLRLINILRTLDF